MTLKDVIFVVYVGVRLMIEQHIEWRYETGVAAIVAGDLPKQIVQKWKAQGSPGAPWATPSS
jgi:hypothetical protein